MHFRFLKDEFTKRFGLPIDSGKRRKITSFDGIQIADGYEEVVTTWQGMFFQLRGEDVIFENMQKSSSEKSNKVTYRIKGVIVFKLKTIDNTAIPKPHRFAVKPPPTHSGPCNPLLPGKWYVHVYQTKVETYPNIFTTLQSKSMARHLKRICGDDYLPRGWDLQTSPASRPHIKDHASTRPQNQTDQRSNMPNEHHQQTISKTFENLPAYPPGFQPQPLYTYCPNQQNQVYQNPQNLPTWQNINTWQPY